MVAAVILAAIATACGSKEQTNEPLPNGSAPLPNEQIDTEEDISSDTDSHDADATPSGAIFSGDVSQLFGLSWEEALKISGTAGTGSVTDQSQYIENESIGLEIFLTNSIDDMTTYKVNEVSFDSADADLSFLGIHVGDTLKDADKILMEQGSIYRGELNWVFSTEEMEYTVKLSTSDDKTIGSVSVSVMEYSEYYPKLQDELDNPFTYEQDMHEIEPIYWE